MPYQPVRQIQRYKTYDSDKEWLIACGTCIHTAGQSADCKGHRLCLVRGQPDQKLLDMGYEFDMNFKYKLWETLYPKIELVELDPELFEI
jgi:hypothetical protein